MENILFDNTLLRQTRKPMGTVENSCLDELHFSTSDMISDFFARKSIIIVI